MLELRPRGGRGRTPGGMHEPMSEENATAAASSPPAPTHTWTSRAAALFLAGLARLLSGASVRWIECEPDTCQRIYFANHTSHLDALVLWASLPRNVRTLTRPVAAKDYWEKGPVRRYIAKRLFHALLIDRNEITLRNNPVRILLSAIGMTGSLIIFPEGSRNTGEEMQPFKSGLYYLSKKRPDLELVPVYIENLNRVLPRGEFLPVPLVSLITFGPPIWLEEGEVKADFLRRARDAVRSLKDR